MALHCTATVRDGDAQALAGEALARRSVNMQEQRLCSAQLSGGIAMTCTGNERTAPASLWTGWHGTSSGLSCSGTAGLSAAAARLSSGTALRGIGADMLSVAMAQRCRALRRTASAERGSAWHRRSKALQGRGVERHGYDVRCAAAALLGLAPQGVGYARHAFATAQYRTGALRHSTA